MKKLILSSLIVVLLTPTINAQVQIDKQIQLTGTGSDAKVTGIQEVSSAQDAASAEVIQKGGLVYNSATGSGGNYLITLTPPVTAYLPGMIINFKANSSNTGAATIDVNNLGAVTIKKQVNADLSANDIASGQMVSVIYDGTYFQMLSQSGNVASGVPSNTCLFSSSSSPPSGYSYSGSTINSGNTWINRAVMTTARYGLATAVVNNKIYAIGGYNGSFLGTNQEYDPATNTWTSKTSMSTQRFYLDAAAVNNKIYVIGGWSQTNVNQEYDPVANTWATKAPMVNARSTLKVVTVNSKIYVLGGSNGGNSQYYNYNEEYNPATDTWTTKANMPVARDGFAAGAINGKIYVAAGFNNNTGYQSVTHVYDPSNDTWTTAASIPTVRRYVYSAVANNKLYVMGGGDPNNRTNNEEYNPATNSWNTVASMVSGRTAGAASTVGNSIFVIGGSTDGQNTGINTNEEFGAPITYYIYCKN